MLDTRPACRQAGVWVLGFGMWDVTATATAAVATATTNAAATTASLLYFVPCPSSLHIPCTNLIQPVHILV